MTELERGEMIREWIALMQTQGTLVNGDSTVIYTLLFGFLLAAHFIGRSLSKPQSIVLTALYITAYAVSLVNIIGNIMANMAMKAPLMDVCPECTFSPLVTPAGILLVFSLYSAMLIASLYFMWSVRHPKTE